MALPFKKTPVGSRIHDSLTTTNDAVCFFAFQNYELGSIIQEEIQKDIRNIHRDSTLADEVFVENPFVGRINLRLKDLESQSQYSLNKSLQMGLLWSVEHALAFISETIFQAEKVKSFNYKLNNDREKIEFILKDICIINQVMMPLHTIDFFRYARNMWAHANDKPSKQFNRFQNEKSKELQFYWNTTHFNKDFSFVFSDFDPLVLNFDDAIYSINLIRVAIARIDCEFAKTIPVDHLISESVTGILESNPTLKGNYERLSRKVRRKIIIEYGLEDESLLTDHEVERVLRRL